MISNINYRGIFKDDLCQFKFRTSKPIQAVSKFDDFTLIVFKSGQCRLMGCKKELNKSVLPFRIKHLRLQSLTVTSCLNLYINLYNLSMKLGKEAMYEPELFPALRINSYKPLCVNVFTSGKLVVTGLKTTQYKDIIAHITGYIISLI